MVKIGASQQEILEIKHPEVELEGPPLRSLTRHTIVMTKSSAVKSN